MISEIIVCDECCNQIVKGDWCFSEDEKHYCLNCALVFVKNNRYTEVLDKNFSHIISLELLRVK